MIRAARGLRVTAVPRSVIAVTALALLGGCSSGFDPSAIPAPGRPGSGAGYPLKVEFANVLNLPGGARVVLNGAPAGRLDKVELTPASAIATVTILNGVRIPRSGTVALTQDTLLGDVYLAIDAASGAGDAYNPGDVIPMSRTKPAAVVEDILIDLAKFLGGGSLMDLQATFSKVVSQLPDDPARLKKTFGTVSRTVNDLASQSRSVDVILESLASITSTAVERQRTIGSLFGEGDRTFLGSNLAVMAYTANIYTELGQVLSNFAGSAPHLDSVTGLISGVVNPVLQPGFPRHDGPSNVATLEKLLREKILPFLRSGSRLDVQSVSTGASDSETAKQMVRNLRMIGAIQ